MLLACRPISSLGKTRNARQKRGRRRSRRLGLPRPESPTPALVAPCGPIERNKIDSRAPRPGFSARLGLCGWAKAKRPGEKGRWRHARGI